jgi:hypothetical protein
MTFEEAEAALRVLVPDMETHIVLPSRFRGDPKIELEFIGTRGIVNVQLPVGAMSDVDDAILRDARARLETALAEGRSLA